MIAVKDLHRRDVRPHKLPTPPSVSGADQTSYRPATLLESSANGGFTFNGSATIPLSVQHDQGQGGTHMIGVMIKALIVIAVAATNAYQ